MKREIYTTVVPGAKPAVKEHKALEVLAKKLGAKIKYLPTLPLTNDSDSIDSFFEESRFVNKDISLNSSLHVRVSMKKRPHVKIPTKRAIKNLKITASVIVPGTSQVIMPQARMGKHPRIVFSPGAITEPNYKDTDTGSEGAMDHFLGAMLFEYNDKKEFYPYNLQFLEDGSLIHLGIHYYPNGRTRKLTSEEITRVDGDDHMDERDPVVEKALMALNKQVKADIKVSHDTFNGTSINHHEAQNLITQAQNAEEGIHRLEHEMGITVKKLEENEAQFKKVVVIAANHNDFLVRFLQSGKYITDKSNWLPSHITAVASFLKVDPIKFFLAHYSTFLVQLKKYMEAVRTDQEASIVFKTKAMLQKTEFLKRGQKFMFGGFDLSPHGDTGANGAKGNPFKMSEFFGFCVSGHNHLVWIFNRSGGGGTTSILDPDYVKGKPSSWGQGCVLVYAPKGYDLGSIQAIHIFDGKYKLKDK